MRSGNPPQCEVGWKASLDAQVRVSPHAGFLDHPHRRHIGPIRLPGQRDHLELNVEKLAEIVRRAERRIRQDRPAIRILASSFCTRSLDLAHGIQVVAHPGAVRGVELAVQAGRRLPHVVEQAVGRVQDGLCVLSWCRPDRTSCRTPCADCFPSAAAASRRSIRDVAARLAAKFQRRQRRVLAQVPRGDLVDRHADARLAALRLRGQDADQPGFFGVCRAGCRLLRPCCADR